MEENKKTASPKKTAPIACRTGSCSSAGAGGVPPLQWINRLFGCLP